MHKVGSLSLGFVLLCLLIAPIYVLTLVSVVGFVLLAMLSGLEEGQKAFSMAFYLFLAGVLLTILIAGLYHKKRLALVSFVLFFPTYIAVLLFGSKLSYSAIGPLLAIYGLTTLAGGLYARELGFIGRR